MTQFSNNIEFAEILIHQIESMPFPVVNTDADEHFGTLNIKMSKTALTTTPLYLLFSIDRTSSMENKRLDYVKATFKNMMRYLASLNITLFIRVHAFYDNVNVIVDNSIVNLDTIDNIISSIDKLVADGTTDIGMAVNVANKAMNEYILSNPTHKVAHIFMTDGEPTVGIRNNTMLSKLVDDNFPNIFIGYGLDHNAQLLRKMSDKSNAEYQFVDNIENTALVYAESLHQFLYPAACCVNITMVNGLIYDWKTNTWKTELYEPCLISETEKIYQIKTTNPHSIEAIISGKMPGQIDMIELETASTLPDLINIDTGLVSFQADLTKYIYRQHVQELLFQARSSRVDNAKEFKESLKLVFRKMHRYMREHDLLNDGLMQLLCDDISLTFRTFDTEQGAMFAIARASSQGRQQTYNVRSSSQTDYPLNDGNDNSFMPPPPLKRTNAYTTSHQDEDEDDEDDDLPLPTYVPTLVRNNTYIYSESVVEDGYLLVDELVSYIPNDSDTTCYATPSILNTMRNMSQQPN